MVIEALNELVTLSDELAQLQGVPPASPQPLPQDALLHPELASVLSCGALGLERQGVDLSRISEFTERARSRGMRRNVLIFGWHPMGHTWFATPVNFGDDAEILELHRLERLRTTDLTVEDFVQRCIASTQEDLEQAKAPKPPPVMHGAIPLADPEAEPEPPKTLRLVKVELPDSAGATLVADGRVEELTGEELAYIHWCLENLALLSDDHAPDLSRWQSRTLRSCRLDAVPAATDPDHARYVENWNRLTRGDRSARGSVSHQVPVWKFAATGSWILVKPELAILRRAIKATPPRHRPDDEQAAVWARWCGFLDADVLELHVH